MTSRQTNPRRNSQLQRKSPQKTICADDITLTDTRAKDCCFKDEDNAVCATRRMNSGREIDHTPESSSIIYDSPAPTLPTINPLTPQEKNVLSDRPIDNLSMPDPNKNQALSGSVYTDSKVTLAEEQQSKDDKKDMISVLNPSIDEEAQAKVQQEAENAQLLPQDSSLEAPNISNLPNTPNTAVCIRITSNENQQSPATNGQPQSPVTTQQPTTPEEENQQKSESLVTQQSITSTDQPPAESSTLQPSSTTSPESLSSAVEETTTADQIIKDQDQNRIEQAPNRPGETSGGASNTEFVDFLKQNYSSISPLLLSQLHDAESKLVKVNTSNSKSLDIQSLIQNVTRIQDQILNSRSSVNSSLTDLPISAEHINQVSHLAKVLPPGVVNSGIQIAIHAFMMTPAVLALPPKLKEPLRQVLEDKQTRKLLINIARNKDSLGAVIKILNNPQNLRSTDILIQNLSILNATPSLQIELQKFIESQLKQKNNIIKPLTEIINFLPKQIQIDPNDPNSQTTLLAAMNVLNHSFGNSSKNITRKGGKPTKVYKIKGGLCINEINLNTISSQDKEKLLQYLQKESTKGGKTKKQKNKKTKKQKNRKRNNTKRKYNNKYGKFSIRKKSKL